VDRLHREVARLQGEANRMDKEIARQKSLRCCLPDPCPSGKTNTKPYQGML